MSWDAIKGGDLVRLKSGGPEMVINSLEGTDTQCVWKSLEGSIDIGFFPVETLDLIRSIPNLELKDIRIGDKLKLKFAPIRVTVSSIESDIDLRCIWFNSKEKQENKVFSKDIFEKTIEKETFNTPSAFRLKF